MKKLLKIKGKKPILENGGYTFATAGNANDMTIKGTKKYSKGNYNNNYNPQTVETIMNGVNTGGTLLSTSAERPDGTVDAGAFTGGEVLKGVSTGSNIGGFLGPIGNVIGGALGAVGGAIYGSVTADNRNRLAEKTLHEENVRKRKEEQIRVDTILSDYPTHGVVGNEYYQKFGGKIKYSLGGTVMPPVLKGGRLDETSSDTATAKGQTHAQGGIELPNAEIEKNEVLHDTGNAINVFSDKLFIKPGVTFAAQADILSKKKGKLEETLESSTSVFAKNSAKRMMQNLDTELKSLHQAQEAMKPTPQNPQQQVMAGGGIYKKSYATNFEKALPYVDNAVNAILTQRTPEIPEPVYDKVVPMKTNFNINPQLIENKNQLANLQTTLQENTSGSNDFRNNVIAANLAATANTNKLYGQKENTETQLINMNRMNTQQVGNVNVGKENQYRTNKMMRIDDIHQRISMNAANASTDAQMQVAQQNQYERDLAELDLLKTRYKETGVWDRNVEATFNSLLKGDIDMNTFGQKLAEAGLDISEFFNKAKNKKDAKATRLAKEFASIEAVNIQPPAGKTYPTKVPITTSVPLKDRNIGRENNTSPNNFYGEPVQLGSGVNFDQPDARGTKKIKYKKRKK